MLSIISLHFFFPGSRLLTKTKACIKSLKLPSSCLVIYITLPLTCCSSSPPIQHMVIAKMSIYKRMKLACCFDCGRSERDCSCMSGSVHSNMDTLERAFPLSSVSVNDCSTSLRACKFNTNTCCSMSVVSVISSPSCVVHHSSVSFTGLVLVKSQPQILI